MATKFTLIICLLTLGIMDVNSQTADSIQIRRKSQLSFIHGGQMVKPGQVLRIIKSNKEAYALMKKANGSRAVGSVVGSIGGFMVGYTLGSAIGGGKISTPVLLAGGALIGISLPFGSSFKKNATKAVDVYNQGLRTPRTDGVMIEVGAGKNGVALMARF